MINDNYKEHGKNSLMQIYLQQVININEISKKFFDIKNGIN